MKQNDLIAFPAGEDALLWTLFARRMADYTGGESTSLRAETAAALLESLQFSLDLYRREGGAVSPDQPPEALLAELEGCVRRRTERTRPTYLWACRCLYQEESLALADTLAGIGAFFRDYDPCYFAAETPCDIDYQLMCPVEETLRGVDYIRAYLDRLLRSGTPEQWRALLVRAGETLSRRLQLGRSAAACVEQLAPDLLPRVEAVLAAGEDWQALFPAFS